MTVVIEGSQGVTGPALEASVVEVRPGSFVRVALAEHDVTGWWVVEDRAGVALVNRKCALVGASDCSVVWSGPMSKARLLNAEVAAGAPMPLWAPVLAASFWAAEWGLARAEEAKAAVRECDARLERIVDAAHAYANDQEFCEAFDLFMIANGLRPRSIDYRCWVDVKIRVEVPATSYSSDAVKITHDMVEAAVRALSGGSLPDEIYDYTVVDVQEA